METSQQQSPTQEIDKDDKETKGKVSKPLFTPRECLLF